MEIGVIPPQDDTLPPERASSSVEGMCASLVMELAKKGHTVHVWVPRNSAVPNHKRIIPHFYPCDSLLSQNLHGNEADAQKLALSRLALQEAASMQLDLVHLHEHTALQALGEFCHFPHPVVTTLHWSPENEIIATSLRKAPAGHTIVPISHALRRKAKELFPSLSFLSPVYNGIDLRQFCFSRRKTQELAFVGRCCPEKAPHRAIQVALSLHRHITLAMKINEGVGREYFEREVSPLIAHNPDLVTFVPEASRDEVANILAHAAVLLMPNTWEEPFGLTCVEALACGTPVVATKLGALPEIIEEGISGYFVDPHQPENELIESLAAAVHRAEALSRRTCRKRARAFSPDRMVDGYIAQYEVLCPTQPATPRWHKRWRRPERARLPAPAGARASALAA